MPPGLDGDDNGELGLLTPGAAHVVHEDQGGDRFRFTLRFAHPIAGETFFQTGVFLDPEHKP